MQLRTETSPQPFTISAYARGIARDVGRQNGLLQRMDVRSPRLWWTGRSRLL